MNDKQRAHVFYIHLCIFVYHLLQMILENMVISVDDFVF